ncbi:alpha/beta hydrolase [Roseimaritima sediminicola]|uniref:alpha/beta hydrolase n=1 Tax=Roseimaritima sediminicola TaxID=2662066 RepID=UPI001386638F|nr:alpha/beta hydrolase [Roseimaritima sediminicola]
MLFFLCRRRTVRALLRGWFVGALCVLAAPARSAADDSAVAVQYDVVYAQRASGPLRCDVFRPPAGPQPPPVVLVVHGGAWRSGDKWMTAGYAQDFAAAGMAVVSINYRLAPEHPFPAAVDDVRDALLWISQTADQYDWDADRIGVFGYSAGAHLVGLLGVLQDELAATQRAASDWPANDPRWQQIPTIRAVAAGGTPSDFRQLPPDNSTLAYFLGGTRAQRPAAYHAASPAAHVSAADPPTLYFHGTGDLIVPYQAAQRMFRQQVDAGVVSEFLTIPGHGHLMTFLDERSRRAARGFLRHHLAGERN